MWDSELYCTCLLSITESCVAADSQIDAAWHTAASARFESGTPRSVSFGMQFLVTQLLKEQKVILSWVLPPPDGLSLSGLASLPTSVPTILSPLKSQINIAICLAYDLYQQ